MPLLSVKIPDKLNRKLLSKGKELGINNQSELVRKLLNFAVEHYDESQAFSKNSWQKKIATYNLLSYFLLEKFVTEGVDNGEDIIEAANKHAEKVAAELLE